MTVRLKKRLTWGAAAVAAILMAAAGCNKNDKSLRVDPPEFNITAASQSMTVRVESSAPWYPYAPDEWILAYPDENDPVILHIEIPDGQSNQSLEPREGVVTVITGDAQTADIRIRQAALDIVLNVSPAELQVFSGTGSTQTLTVTSENISDWSYNTSLFVTGGWLTLTRDANLLSVTAARSDLFEQRRDTIFIYPAAEELQSVRDTITVVQAAVKLILVNPDMDGESLSAGPEAAEAEFTIASTENWTVTADNDAVPSEPSGEANTAGEPFTVSIPANQTAETVTYTLTFTCGGEDYTYTIVQSPAESGGQ